MFTNYFKTTILLSTLSALLVLIGYYLGGNSGMISFFVISLFINFISYFFSGSIALMYSGSKEVKREEAPDIYQDTEMLAEKMGIPTPKIYISDENQPNAFATGRNPKNGVISLTRGLLQRLSREEVKGVIAHELAHIKNRDILISSIAAVLASTLSMIARSFLWFGGGGRSDDNNKGAFTIFGELLLLLLAPMVALIIQMAISRNREFAADQLAAETMNSGSPLASALLKIHDYRDTIPMDVNPAMGSMYILNPFKSSAVTNLFSTHPPVEKRIEKLKQYM